jgi:hypothetical protein
MYKQSTFSILFYERKEYFAKGDWNKALEQFFLAEENSRFPTVPNYDIRSEVYFDYIDPETKSSINLHSQFFIGLCYFYLKDYLNALNYLYNATSIEEECLNPYHDHCDGPCRISLPLVDIP